MICEPMCTWMPTARSDGRAAIAWNSDGAMSIGTPNLFALQPGRDVGVALGVDVGIDAQGHPRHRAAIGGQARQPIELAGRFHVDGEQVERHGAFEFVRRLPTPVKTISSGRKPQRSATSTSPIELASAPLPSARTSRTMASAELALSA